MLATKAIEINIFIEISERNTPFKQSTKAIEINIFIEISERNKPFKQSTVNSSRVC